jgi:hypothetical protein
MTSELSGNQFSEFKQEPQDPLKGYQSLQSGRADIPGEPFGTTLSQAAQGKGGEADFQHDGLLLHTDFKGEPEADFQAGQSIVFPPTGRRFVDGAGKRSVRLSDGLVAPAPDKDTYGEEYHGS